MGNHHNGESFLIETGEQVHDLIGCLGIESAGWLVGQEYIGLRGQRARDCNPLLLTAGELGGAVLGPRSESNLLQVFECQFKTLFARDALVIKGQGDVLERSLEGQEIKRLKDESQYVGCVDLRRGLR